MKPQPLKEISKDINKAQEEAKKSVPANHQEPASKKLATMKAGMAQKNGDLIVPPDAQNAQESHSAPVIRGQSKHSKQAIAAKVVRELLSDKDGPLNRQQLLEFSRSPIKTKDVRPIPRTWPAQLITAKDIWTWGDKLIKSHQKIFTKEGQQTYAKAVINAVFPDDANKPAHLP